MKTHLVRMILLSLILFPSTTYAEKIELKNGDTLDVKVIERKDGDLVVEHPQLGKMLIPKKDIKPPTPPNSGLLGTSILAGWDRSLGAGLSGSSGNSNDFSFNGELSTSRSAATYRGRFLSTFFFASKESAEITNAFYAGYTHDFLWSGSKFFLFANGIYQFDEFQAWRHRVSANLGPGYDILRGEKFTMSSTLGIGASRTWGTENEWKPEGVVGLSMSWKPWDNQSFSASVTYYPDLQNLPEFRLLSQASYTVGLKIPISMSVKFGVLNEYDSSQPGKNNNLKYFANLVYDF